MNNVEGALAKVWENVGKLDDQIDSVIRMLCNENILEITEAFPIAGNSSTSTANKNHKQKGEKIREKIIEKAGNNRKLGKSGPTGGLGGLSSSSKKKIIIDEDDAMEIDVPDSHIFGDNNSRSADKKTDDTKKLSNELISMDEDSTFLIPVMDKWVFGATLLNISKIDLRNPKLILKFADQNLPGSFTLKSFSWNWKVGLVNAEKEFHFNNNPDILPVQETLFSSLDDEIIIIPPGAKFFVSASFTLPIMQEYNSEKSLLVSLLSDDLFLWSKMLKFNPHSVAVYEQKLQLFQERILTQLSEHSDAFGLEEYGSNNGLLLLKSLQNFLTQELGLDKIQSAQTKFDTKVDSFASNKQYYIWGLLVQIRVCLRDLGSIKAAVSARNPEQFDYFRRIFLSWVEGQKQNYPGLRICPKNKITGEALSAALQREIKAVIHFIYLFERELLNLNATESDKVLMKWLQTFMKEMSCTDSICLSGND